ncbi:hypothetical protein D3C75_1085220 [compost metagenome]
MCFDAVHRRLLIDGDHLQQDTALLTGFIQVEQQPLFNLVVAFVGVLFADNHHRRTGERRNQVGWGDHLPACSVLDTVAVIRHLGFAYRGRRRTVAPGNQQNTAEDQRSEKVTPI